MLRYIIYFTNRSLNPSWNGVYRDPERDPAQYDDKSTWHETLNLNIWARILGLEACSFLKFNHYIDSYEFWVKQWGQIGAKF